MKDTGIKKDEIMKLLTDMNTQLENIEADMHSSMVKVQKDWYQLQVSKLETCGEKLKALENKISQNEERLDDGQMNYQLKKVSSLELGYEYN
ncbi:hypothetical protein [Bacillus sp. B15-48]|uniref:hypothetical protein n=1 Tax=Bacillus sp. B15-48 TaxID=1548601 RepID=UPI00193FBC90|nr:hypothetical protein [Bacillus sp. B15-48]MBM4762085.1 hypothetical protein [Bacillus sp. B15-48]